MATYGHFTVGEYEARSGPYFERGGQWYRITDVHVVAGLDRVNYQAEEMTDHEVGVMLAEEPRREDEAAGAPQAEGTQVEDLADVMAASLVVEPVPQQPPVQSWVADVPTLAQFARQRGWKVGRISNRMKAQYLLDFPHRVVEDGGGEASS